MNDTKCHKCKQMTKKMKRILLKLNRDNYKDLELGDAMWQRVIDNERILYAIEKVLLGSSRIQTYSFKTYRHLARSIRKQHKKTRFEIYNEVKQLLEKEPNALTNFKNHGFFTEEFEGD